MVEPGSDGELWREVARGDHAAFGRLFERHGTAVYNYLFRRCGDGSEAEDMTALVFMEAWRSRAKVVMTGDGSALPWLYGVATNTLRRRWRTRMRHRRAVSRLAAERPERDFSEDADQRVEAERRARQLLRHLRHLSRTDREVITLCLGEGLSYEDAAIALGIPIGTVRSRLSRARRRLADAEAGDCARPHLEGSGSL
jgi:RNA polymerase sigma factor (sigma-70 family)